MKTSVISRGVPQALSLEPQGPERLRGPRRSCSTGRRTTTTASTIPTLKIDEHCMLFIRGAGPIGYPGGAEVVNMQPPAALIKQGVHCAALHRRRPPVRHLRLALDPQRLARSGGRRRAGAAEDRRPGAHRPQQAHRQHPDQQTPSSTSAAQALAAHGGYRLSRRTRRRGRRSSAAWSTSSARAWC